MCDAPASLKHLQIVGLRDSSSEGNVSSLSYVCVKLRWSQAFAGDGVSWGVGHRARRMWLMSMFASSWRV